MKAPLSVVLLHKQRRRRVHAARIRGVLRRAARALKVTGEIALVLGGDARIRTLNRRYLCRDEPTDVLSFPGPGGGLGIGDVVISVEAASRNARRFGRSLAEELDVLALHGFLHTLGYDHETDKGEMERLEQRLRRKLGLVENAVGAPAGMTSSPPERDSLTRGRKPHEASSRGRGAAIDR